MSTGILLQWLVFRVRADREYYVSVFLSQVYQVRHREHLLNRSAQLRDSICILETEPGKPDISNRD